MSNFEYIGQLPTGPAVTGTVEAADANEAAKNLSGIGIRVTAVNPTSRIRLARALSRDDVLFFNEQLASLAQTGLALDQGLRILAKDLRRGRLRTVIEELAQDLERGVPLEDAVAARPGRFPPLYAQVLKAGVQSNQLGSTLVNLGTHLKLMGAGRRLFWESAVYPIIVILFGFALLSFFMRSIVPQFETLSQEIQPSPIATFGESEQPSAPDPLLVALSQFIYSVARHWNWIAGILVSTVLALGLGFWFLGRGLAGQRIRDAILDACPGIGGVRRMSLLARFSQAAALGAHAGQDLPTVLRLASGATGSRSLVADAEILATRIESGMPAAEAALSTTVIPPIFGYTAHIAGGRGQLSAALGDMARVYDELARYRLAMFKMLVMPILILITAIFIGLGIFGLMIPLVSLINNLTGG